MRNGQKAGFWGENQGRAQPCGGVDIGGGPSYLSFDFASRTVFWTLFCMNRYEIALPGRGAGSPVRQGGFFG